MWEATNTKTGHKWVVSATEMEDFKKDVLCRHYTFIEIKGQAQATKAQKTNKKNGGSKNQDG